MRLPVLGWGPMEPPIPVRGQGLAERHLGEDCVDQRSNDLLTRKGMITVSTPVFLLVLGEGHTEAWYQLSKEEQDDLWAKVQEVDRRAGAVVHIVCDSRWADESLLDWVVIEYPRTSTPIGGKWRSWRNSTGIGTGPARPSWAQRWISIGKRSWRPHDPVPTGRRLLMEHAASTALFALSRKERATVVMALAVRGDVDRHRIAKRNRCGVPASTSFSKS